MDEETAKDPAQERTTLDQCQDLVAQTGRTQAMKRAQYGPSLAVFRFSSLVEKIFIKAKRIRTIQETKANLVGDSVQEDLAGIFSYAVLAIAKHRDGPASVDGPSAWETPEAAQDSYDRITGEVLALLAKKNHDYGEAWRQLSSGTMIDEILSRTVRIESLSKAKEDTSAAIEDQLFDVANYALFLLIKDRETTLL